MARPSSDAPFRTFTGTSDHVLKGTPVAIGRAHASLLLIYTVPKGIILARETPLSLNFIDPADPSTVPGEGVPISTDGAAHPPLRFVIRSTTLDSLLALRDNEGRAPAHVVKRFPPRSRRGPLVEVELDVAENELAHACARCGRWEALYGPRFMRCGGCRSRRYCSKECQKADWKKAYHKSECALLKEGKAAEVEGRRRLHDNGRGSPSPHDGGEAYERAMDDCDYLFLAHGMPSPPRDAPPGTVPPRPSPDTPVGPNGLPVDLFSTGSASTDIYLRDMFQAKRKYGDSYGAHIRVLENDFADMRMGPPPARAAGDQSSLPPLPSISGFTPTGDESEDEIALFDYVGEHGTEAQQEEVMRAIDARMSHREHAMHGTVDRFREAQNQAEYWSGMEKMLRPPGMDDPSTEHGMLNGLD
ncbi:uncharacterized protein BXZ73DRAFT_43718 [Epithele typhae]|uniref:uncharacterized protein n=1 Tax=Epithele typhae TaxID=378194 RepID=UPI002008D8E8|nr:uncharacterized protein BXZ73DRAFT_43718 [Epithele typhae]KAH9939402.1 hypothetical protein BXZ73DRAFT_43718 [Epithele typhae]